MEWEMGDDAEQHDIEVGLEVKMSLQYTRTEEISLYEQSHGTGIGTGTYPGTGTTITIS